MNKNEWPKLSFATQFNYLHIVDKGTVTTDGTANIPLPDGLDNPFFRVFVIRGDDIQPVLGYYGTGTEAHIDGPFLSINVGTGGGGGSPPEETFSYFIYGGNYV